MKKINKYLIFSFLISFLSLLFTSKNSFLYVFNDWVDANSFFTVGKSMINGLVLYRDVFDQKGPLLYFIYGIGYLFSNKTFHGVFILEVVSFAIFLYFIYKIIALNYNKKYSLIVLPILAVLITTDSIFVQGGSCEELCLPFIGVSLYYFFKHFKYKELTYKEMLINGLMAGSILMMKYTLLGFWIGFCLFIGINLIYKKEFKKLLIYALIFLLGMFIPFLIGVIYFIIVGGFKDFIDSYFILNITSYSFEKDAGLFKKILSIIKYIFVIFMTLPKMAGLLYINIIALLLSKKDKLFKISVFGIIAITVFFICCGVRSYIYYNLPIFTLISICTLLFMIEILKKYIDKIINKKVFLVLIVLILICSTIISYFGANYKEEISYSKKDYVQYKYAKYVSKYKNPTLINMGYLDIGVFTVSGIIPNTKFFEYHNFEYDDFRENYDEMINYVVNKKIKFIVYIAFDGDEPPEFILDNYELVYKDKYANENFINTSYFYKLKDLKEGS